ncbi:hypothetical protein [Phytohabitans rumicis]|uniref:Uncharacterized protein n=1 Tax=Phytohabitans rumicis TaxID=1076125 RepID=A0A6V8LFZ0_9ACTN|nr:hypothetical protein [Phytohabitans rumicis]GFJ92996.1 hypothetical protein Prum_066380 [Phytohabitans rumicis]
MRDETRRQDHLNDLLGELSRALELLAVPRAIFNRTLRYEDVITWFIDNRPRGGVAQAGAVLRGPAPGGRLDIIQVFLDGQHSVACGPGGKPYGRRLEVHALDDELSEAFGQSDLLLVQ